MDLNIGFSRFDKLVSLISVFYSFSALNRFIWKNSFKIIIKNLFYLSFKSYWYASLQTQRYVHNFNINQLMLYQEVIKPATPFCKDFKTALIYHFKSSVSYDKGFKYSRLKFTS